MAQTAEAKVSFRGRRPGVQTLDARLEEIEAELSGGDGKISNRRLSEMHEAATLLEYHYNAHKKKGKRVGDRIKRVEKILEEVAVKTEFPSINGTADQTPQRNTALDKVRLLREERRKIEARIEELVREEESLYSEVGRLTVEEAFGA